MGSESIGALTPASPKIVETNKTMLLKNAITPEQLVKHDNLVMRVLVDYMANSLFGPFQVILKKPTLLEKIFRRKGITYHITGPDSVNRLKIEFANKGMAEDMAETLNRAYGFDDLKHWMDKK